MNRSSINAFRALLLALALILGLCATACYVEARAPGVEADWEVDGPPPPLQEEVVVTRPGAEFVWIPGYWDWDLGVRRYVWREGRWDHEHRGERWVAPRYEKRGERHYYRRGHWAREGERGREREHRDRDRD